MINTMINLDVVRKSVSIKIKGLRKELKDIG